MPCYCTWNSSDTVVFGTNNALQFPFTAANEVRRAKDMCESTKMKE